MPIVRTLEELGAIYGAPAETALVKDLPSPGQILAALSDRRVGGEAYDREWPQRARKSLW